MTSDEFQEKFWHVFRETLDLGQADLPPNLKMGEIEPWDSFAHINLVLALENSFGIEFSSDEIGELTSVPKLQAGIEARIRSAS